MISLDKAEQRIKEILELIQKDILKKAKNFRDNNSHNARDYDEFKNLVKNNSGFIYAHWDGTEKTEEKIKSKLLNSLFSVKSLQINFTFSKD